MIFKNCEPLYCVLVNSIILYSNYLQFKNSTGLVLLSKVVLGKSHHQSPIFSPIKELL